MFKFFKKRENEDLIEGIPNTVFNKLRKYFINSGDGVSNFMKDNGDVIDTSAMMIISEDEYGPLTDKYKLSKHVLRVDNTLIEDEMLVLDVDRLNGGRQFMALGHIRGYNSYILIKGQFRK